MAADGNPAQVRPDTPLTRWLRAALWGALLIPLTLFVVAAWWGYQRAQQDALATAARASELAQLHAQRTLDIAADIAHRVDAVTSGPDEDVRAAEGALHQRLTDLIAGLPSVLNMNVWDVEGRPLVGSDTYPANRDQSVADRDYFRGQREPGSAVDVSEVIIGRQSGRRLANVVLRRAAPDGAFRGIVAVSITPTYFSDYYESLAGEAPGVARYALVRLDGKTIARWSASAAGGTDAAADDDPGQAEALRQVRAGQLEGRLQVTAPGSGESTIVGYKRVAGYPLLVVAGFAHQQMLAGWTRFVGLLAAVLLPTTLGLVCVSWVALKRTRQEQATAAELQAETRRRAAAERAMLESQKFETLALLTGGVAHDFNNLLAVVNTSLHVLNRQQPALAETKQMKAIGRSVQTGVRLTRQLLSFSRKQALRPEVVDLRSWLPATEGLAQSALRPGVSWELALDAHPLPVEVDVGELELALINLVVNANLAMPDGGRVTVAAHPTPGEAAPEPHVTLAVSDTGVGIPAELLDKVCEPFFTTRGPGAGSGLGLSQVQSFCVRAGGRLRIESRVGVGTTVRIELPRAAMPAPAGPALPDDAAERIEGRVLLVEDNPEVAQTMEAMLRAAGLDVVSAASASAALALLDDTGAPPPDAVLSDIEMPGRVNGITLAFALRTRWPDLPVLLVTGYADQIDEATAGGLRVLAKPVAPTHLLAELRTLIGRRRAQ